MWEGGGISVVFILCLKMIIKLVKTTVSVLIIFCQHVPKREASCAAFIYSHRHFRASYCSPSPKP